MTLATSVRSRVERILQHRRWRYVAAGAVNTVFGLSIYPVLWFVLAPLKLHYLVVLVLAQVSSVLFAFLNTKRYVFRTHGNHLHEAWKFALFHACFSALNLATLPLLVEILKINPLIAQTAYAVLAVIAGYVWHSRVTFRSGTTEGGLS